MFKQTNKMSCWLDRLTHERCLDRIQVDLMGHKFDREKYGIGASLEEKYIELKKIQLKPE
jgi:hypothetical protein